MGARERGRRREVGKLSRCEKKPAGKRGDILKLQSATRMIATVEER